MQETRVQPLGRQDPLEKEMATHSSILAWEIHGRKSLVAYSPRGRKESDTTKQFHFHFTYLLLGSPPEGNVATIWRTEKGSLQHWKTEIWNEKQSHIYQGLWRE